MSSRIITLDVTANARHNGLVIRSFRCKHTEALVMTGKCHKSWRAIQAVAERKLVQLADAVSLADLARPPANRLEALKGDRAGQYSIRINSQYRICFVWTDVGPEQVEIVDYH